jgi:hypothetical protein
MTGDANARAKTKRVCTSGKDLSASSDDARREARRRGLRLGVYYCPECWHWHLTKKEGMKRAVIADSSVTSWLPKVSVKL